MSRHEGTKARRHGGEDNPHIVIAGAGLAGSLLACMLARRGYRIDLVERRPDPRAKGFIGGRSINLALSCRGISALERVGVHRAVLDDAIPMQGRMMHSSTGDLAFQPYSKNPADAINSVSRGGLNLTLLEAANRHENVTLHFGLRCAKIDLDGPSVQLQDEAGQGERLTCDLLIGADGAFSAVRSRMQKTDRFCYSQTYLEHGYKELCIPPAEGGGFAMEQSALHIWPRGGSMMIALPNPDCSFTCTLFWPFSGPAGFDALSDTAGIRAFFERHYGDAVPLMPTLVEDYQNNPTSSLVTVRCNPWHYRDTTLLVGDAAHAVVPFYGQGMNAAFEDCVVFDQCVEQYGPAWDRVLPAYTAARKENGDAIADLALDNFIEMRDKVGSRAFLMKKRTEKILHRLLPRWYTPLYNMVTFSNIPYADARRQAARQSRIIAVGAVAGLALLGGLLVWLAMVATR